MLTDLKLLDGDGFGVLRAAKELDDQVPVVVMTAYGSIQDAVMAMKEGAMDFLAKPVDPDHLLLIVERAIAQRRMHTEYILLKEELAERRGAPRIIGEDAHLRQVSQQLHRAAATDATVLIEGESGTGKELFARALHALSPRADGPFVAINCAAIPETLLETELFGHEKGAFTGAAARKPGRFELAHRGTLFLDEIGELPLALQAKILRALEQKSFERVGGTQSITVDVRVVAATNRNLKARVAERQFREDLYFRLSVFPIQIPPLRERTDDVVILARHFVDKFSREVNKPPLRLSRRGTRRVARVSVARQRARVAELHRASGHPLRRRHDSSPPPEFVVPAARRASAGQSVGADRFVGLDDGSPAPGHRRSRAPQGRTGAARRRRQQAASRRAASDDHQDVHREAAGTGNSRLGSPAILAPVRSRRLPDTKDSARPRPRIGLLYFSAGWRMHDGSVRPHDRSEPANDDYCRRCRRCAEGSTHSKIRPRHVPE